jgi:hypothetical protein
MELALRLGRAHIGVPLRRRTSARQSWSSRVPSSLLAGVGRWINSSAGSGSASQLYPSMLQPLKVGGGDGVDSIVLKNRVVMGSMHTNLEEFSLSDLAGALLG